MQSQAAQAEAPDAEYTRLIEAALAAYDSGRWADARGFFERAHGQQPNARTLFGLGVTAFELGRHAQAIDELRAALADPRLPLSGAQRGEAEAIIKRAGPYVAFVHIDVAPPDARVLIDGAPTGARELTLAPGDYVFAASAPRFRPSEQRIHVVAGQQLALKFNLEALDLAVHRDGSDPARVSQSGPEARDTDTDVLESWWFWTLVGVAVAGGVTAAVLVSSDDDDGLNVSKVRTVLQVQP